MAKEDKPEKAEKVDPRQKQANHFAAVLADMQAVVADPASTPEEVAEANNTIQDMEKNIRRLNEKFSVSPDTPTTT